MKPKILSIKTGYNPNSSSIGIALSIFIYHSLLISILFSTIGFLLNFKRKKPGTAENEA